MSKGGRGTACSTDKALARQSFLGADGIKVHNGAVWAANLVPSTAYFTQNDPDLLGAKFTGN
ncbi:hypothetical protein AB0E08_18405 [Streptomyces sp. NPDC048281]|uniref:hypothetical protein n=1 Tax=Streptomyces sp. NPDC048281 TaxID=3154715 RepID=UPI0034160C29